MLQNMNGLSAFFDLLKECEYGAEKIFGKRIFKKEHCVIDLTLYRVGRYCLRFMPIYTLLRDFKTNVYIKFLLCRLSCKRHYTSQITMNLLASTTA